VYDGLTTSRLAQQASEMDFIKSQVLHSSQVYTNVDERVEAVALSEQVGANYYSLDSFSELPQLAQSVATDLALAKNNNKNAIVAVSKSVPLTEFDTVVQQLD
jgi:hypothetical protein